MKIFIQLRNINDFSDLQYQTFFETLGTVRKAEISRLCSQEDQKRSILAGHLIQEIAKKYGCNEDTLIKKENGKLFFSEPDAPIFNVSHSGAYVLCVSAKPNSCATPSLGVDVQQIRALKEGVAKRILHEQEKMVNDCRELNRIWTAKEAFVKMTGKGLATDFRKLKVDFEAMTCIDTENQQTGYLFEIVVEEGYFSYVCTSEFPNEYQISKSINKSK